MESSPIKQFVENLYRGLLAFYPANVLGEKEGKNVAFLNTWKDFRGISWTRKEFQEYVLNWTNTNDIDEAVKIVLDWKSSLDNGQPTPNMPPQELIEEAQKIDEEEVPDEEKKERQIKWSGQVAKVINKDIAPQTTQPRDVGRSIPAVIKRATPTKKGKEIQSDKGFALGVKKAPFTPQGAIKSLIYAPFRFAVSLGAKRLYEDDPEAATAALLLSKGITPGKLAPLRQQALMAGITNKEFDKLVSTMSDMPTGRVLELLSGYKSWGNVADMSFIAQEVYVSREQVGQVFLGPTFDETSLIASSSSFGGNLLFRFGQKVFGRAVASALKSAITTGAGEAAVAGVTGAAAGATTGAATGAAAGAAAGGPAAPLTAIIGAIVGFIIEKVGKDAWSKIKVFWQKHKGAVAAFMLAGAGFLIGGPIGLTLMVAGGVAGLGALAGGGFVAGASTLGALAGSFVFGLTNIVFASIATPLIIAAIVFPIFISLIIFIINSSAFVIPGQLTSIAGLPGGINPISSPYMDVVKSASVTTASNDQLPLTVDYTITILAKKSDLTKLRFTSTCDVLKKDSRPVCPDTKPSIPANVTDSVKAGSTYTFKYSQIFDANFQDSQVTDIFTVTADTTDQLGVTSAGSASVRIGNPPEDCPSGWPTTGVLTQGAYTGSSHAGAEALDIASPGGTIGTPIRATHGGIARVHSDNTWPYGRYIEVDSTCNGKKYLSRYAHLSVITINNGQKVDYAQTIGLMGNTGNSTGVHLHYEFRYPTGPTQYPNNPPFMAIDPKTGQAYIPRNLKNRNCVGEVSCDMNIP
ncbi:M23 family metallopeptidase [Candidatus Woesebacteria bacterium]|nr:M23 family metallopeptidase [Candidatus Woesebacteria bacterium]